MLFNIAELTVEVSQYGYELLLCIYVCAAYTFEGGETATKEGGKIPPLALYVEKTLVVACYAPATTTLGPS